MQAEKINVFFLILYSKFMVSLTILSRLWLAKERAPCFWEMYATLNNNNFHSLSAIIIILISLRFRAGLDHILVGTCGYDCTVYCGKLFGMGGNSP